MREQLSGQEGSEGANELVAAAMARVVAELEEARQQLLLASSASSAEVAQVQVQALAQVQEVQALLEVSQAELGALRDEREAERSHMEDVAEQRDALKEAVQDIQVS